MIGPESISGTTKCTVAPWIFTPAASARACVSRPLNAGSSDGWMLSIRPLPALARTSGVSSRMNPPRQTSSIAVRVERRLQRALERRAVLAERLVVDDLGRDAGRARASQGRRHPAGSTSTSAISAG